MAAAAPDASPIVHTPPSSRIWLAPLTDSRGKQRLTQLKAIKPVGWGKYM
jgi:hypothetical protein